MTDRTVIVERLARQRQELEARYRAFGDDDLLRPCTDSEDPGGSPWTAKDHLAHLIRIETAFLDMAKSALDGDEAPVKIPGRSFAEKLASVHAANEEHVRASADLDLEEILQRLAAARADTIAFIDRVSDEDLATPIPGAPWGDGTIGGVLAANALHERQHLDWVEEGLAS